MIAKRACLANQGGTITTATLRAVDVPRLLAKKPREEGLPIRLVLKGDKEAFDTYPLVATGGGAYSNG